MSKCNIAIHCKEIKIKYFCHLLLKRGQKNTKGVRMFKKVTTGFLVLATSAVFGMSLNQLNKADKQELMEINGIGEVKADAIIKERKKGKFKSYEDFQRVDGVGPSIADNVKKDVKKSQKPKSKSKTNKDKTK